jgi:hypothetical protein
MNLLALFSCLGVTLYLTENTDSLSYKDQSRRNIINTSTFSHKTYPVLKKMEMYQQIERTPITKFHETLSVGIPTVPCGQTDGRQSGITELVVDFDNWYANAPKNNTHERLFRGHWFKFANTAYGRTQHPPL